MTIDMHELRQRPLCDAALLLQVHDAWHRNPPAPELESVFPDASAEEIASAKRKASSLLARAFSVGDEALANRHSNYPELVARLQAAHPGFIEASYLEVIGFGCFLAR